jgi:Acyl-coenzyme A:6-aminopenicillanic acid acyl-transferase
MGYEQGQRLQAEILAARNALEQLESFRIEQPWWLPFRAFRHLAERRAERILKEQLSRQFPNCHARLLGIADGAGVRPSVVYLLNAIEALLSAVRDHVVVPPPGACSAVAVRGQRSLTGEPIIAKNFDYLPLVQPFYFVRESRPESGLRSIEFTVAPLAGTIDGINEKGLCICNNYAFTVDTTMPTATISMVIAEALQQCSTVTEAADFIATRPRWGSGLLMIADAQGDVGSLEVSNTRCRLRRPAEGADVLAHTNAFRCPDMCAIEVPSHAVFTKHAPASLRGTRLHQSAELRDERFAQLLQASTPFGPDELATLMADHGPDDVPTDTTICVHSDYWNTTATMQLFPRRRSMRVDFSSACSAQFQELELG